MGVRFDVFDARDLLALPGGDNATDSFFAGVHFNVTTLQHWNYTLYSNNTLSNGSNCYLTFPPYEPKLFLSNGTFINATNCWSAIYPIGTRGFTGIGFAVVYALALILTITVLAKHGALHLPKERRFYPIGRRWQWYWGCFVCACALVSLFTNVDVDRYYVQELPIVVTVFFWFLLCQGTVALAWEAVRHWGSWLERQYIDPDPFIYRQDDRRSMIEFWLPLWFYFWVWMNFFLVVPRNWTFAEMQRSPDQTLSEAVPTATGARFKAAAFCLFIAWLTILFSLRHSIQHYKPRHRGILDRAVALAQAVPLRIVLIIPLTLAMIAYQAFISFVWEYSIIRYDGVVPVIFAWGYGPTLLILYIQLAYGFASPNEDKELIRQRRERGDIINRELGIVKRPAWWRRVRGDHLGSLRDKILRNVNEVGGKRGVGRRVEDDMERHVRLEAERCAVDDTGGGGGDDDIELQRIRCNKPRVDKANPPRRNAEQHMAHTAAAAGLPPGDVDVEARRAQRAAYLMEMGPPPPPYSDAERHESEQPGLPASASSLRTNSTSTTGSATGPPQRVRSMLDV